MRSAADEQLSTAGVASTVRTLQGVLQRSCSQTPVQRGLAPIRTAIASITEGRCLVLSGEDRVDAALRSRSIRLGVSEIHILRWESGCDLETVADRSRDDRIAIYVPLRGGFEARQGISSVSVAPGQFLLATQRGALHRTWRGRLDMVNLLVERRSMAEGMLATYGTDISRSVDLSVRGLDSHAALMRMLETVLLDAADGDPCLAGTAAAPVGQALVALALRALAGANGLAALDRPRGPAPYYVRRVQKFIEQRSSKPIGMDDMTSIAGVSRRTLHYGYKRFLHTTPMKALAQARLRAARRILESEGGVPNIARVAMEVGYGSASHFARDYKAIFGEQPRQTVQRGGAGAE